MPYWTTSALTLNYYIVRSTLNFISISASSANKVLLFFLFGYFTSCYKIMYNTEDCDNFATLDTEPAIVPYQLTKAQIS